MVWTSLTRPCLRSLLVALMLILRLGIVPDTLVLVFVFLQAAFCGGFLRFLVSVALETVIDPVCSKGTWK